MVARFSAFLTLALLLILPLQGIAVAMGSVECASSDAHHTLESDTHVHTDDGTQHAPGNTDGSGADESAAGHLCCHHFSAGIPVTLEKLAELSPTLASRSTTSSHTLFIPEQPQRPPRTVLG